MAAAADDTALDAAAAPASPARTSFTSFDGTAISFLDAGVGKGTADAPAVLLIHGYAANATNNWVEAGVFGALRDAGRRVIAIDLRGHGESASPHDAAAYGDGAMRRDCACLLAHLGIAHVDIVGYSMGCSPALWLTVLQGTKASTDGGADAVAPGSQDWSHYTVRRLVLGGHGDGLGTGWGDEADSVAVGLLAESDEGLSELQVKYRQFVAWQGGDAVALAHVASAWRGRIVPPDVWPKVSAPVLILVGAEDDIPLAELPAGLPDARVERPPGSHVTAPAMPQFRELLLAFLAPAAGGRAGGGVAEAGAGADAP